MKSLIAATLLATLLPALPAALAQEDMNNYEVTMSVSSIAPPDATSTTTTTSTSLPFYGLFYEQPAQTTSTETTSTTTIPAESSTSSTSSDTPAPADETTQTCGNDVTVTTTITITSSDSPFPPFTDTTTTTTDTSLPPFPTALNGTDAFPLASGTGGTTLSAVATGNGTDGGAVNTPVFPTLSVGPPPSATGEEDPLFTGGAAGRASAVSFVGAAVAVFVFGMV